MRKSNLNDRVVAVRDETTGDWYLVHVEPDDSGFFVEHPGLPGCMADGTTLGRALKKLAVHRRAYIESLISEGLPVPPGFRQARTMDLVSDQAVPQSSRTVSRPARAEYKILRKSGLGHLKVNILGDSYPQQKQRV